MAGQSNDRQEKSESVFGELFGLIIWVVVAVMILRSFVFQPFRIPSESMVPTLENGDFIYVSMYSYGYGPKSFFRDVPVTQIINRIVGRDPQSRIFEKMPERGDIVVFRTTDSRMPQRVVIKRVVGLPGDTVETRDGVLYINGQAASYDSCRSAYSNSNEVLELTEGEAYRDVYGRGFVRVPLDAQRCVDPSYSASLGFASGGLQQVANVFMDETMPSFDGEPGHTYTITEIVNGSFDNFAGTTNRPSLVREGHLFMMGDNRDQSGDSRTSSLDQVPMANVIGQAHFTIFSLNMPVFDKMRSGEWWRLLTVWDWLRWDRFARPLI